MIGDIFVIIFRFVDPGNKNFVVEMYSF